MDKTVKINLSGILFQIDEEAYYILRDYLKAIDSRFKNVQGGNETIEDIESRIAEIFQSQKGLTGVISKENVQSMIEIIGNPSDFDQPGSQHETLSSGTFRRRLYRNPDDSILSGVCGGIGAYLNLDPVWIRIIFILLTICFAIGLFIYAALWIALPKAVSDSQKRELYGDYYNYRTDRTTDSSGQFVSPGSRADSVSGAFNEVFRAIGKFFFIVFRIIMILFGVTFVVGGFALLASFIILFFFKYPGFVTIGSFDTNLLYLPDFIGFIVNPGLAPWVLILIFIAVALPLLAVIYWGVKMIFWFRANDGILSLIFLVIWVLSITALAVISFNEGVSFAEEGRAISQVVLETTPDTLYIITDRKVKDLNLHKEFSFPDEDYAVFLSDSTRLLYIRTWLSLRISNDKSSKVEIRKDSYGRTRSEATAKAESLQYNYRISNDTIWLDEYFTLSPANKWTADYIGARIYVPEKTVLFFDNSSENMFHDRILISRTDDDTEESETHVDYDTEPWELGNKFWIITSDGLKEAEKVTSKQK